MQRHTRNVQPPTQERFRDADTGFEGWRLRVGSRSARRRGIPTPAVCGHRLYFGGGFGSHEFYAVGARSGDLLWTLHTSDDGPTAAVVDRERVAFNTESCTLEVVDAARGSVLWSRWLGDPLLAQPAMAGDRILMVYPKGGRHWLQAFGAATGEPHWKRPLGHDVITAPVVAGERVYLSTFDGTVHCFALEAGDPLWSRQMQATSAPWVHGGRVYVAQRAGSGSSDRKARGVHGQASGQASGGAGGSDDVRPADGSPGQRDRTQSRSPRPRARPMERTSHVGADLGEGDEAFEAQWAPYLSADWGHEAKAEYAVDDAAVGFAQAPAAAKIQAIQALVGEKGVARAWRFQGSRPVVADGILFETTGDRLEARDAESGESLWSWTDARTRAGERRLTPPAVANGRVLAGTWDGRLLSWEAATGRLRWAVRLGAACHWQPVMSQGWVYAGLEDGSLVGIETADPGDDGWEMWGGGPGHNGVEVA